MTRTVTRAPRLDSSRAVRVFMWRIEIGGGA